MYIVVNNVQAKSGRTYRTVLLRESYREGKKVKNRTIANLSACSPAEIEAMRLALRHKDDLSALGSLRESMTLRQGPSIGAIWAVYQVARRQGIEAALGTDFMGQLALWQVIARVIQQGSRLSAVRLAQTQAACEVLRFARGFDENDLYGNLKWLSEHQTGIEDRLFAARGLAGRPRLFLYDVTSSYLEGQKNALAAYGYNRDGKRGKKQIVVGLLCDEAGEPIATEVFRGNTQDTKTFASQVRTVAGRFGCERVTFVGDRGMIKSGQIETLGEAGFHFITAVTKPQIEALIKRGVLQPELFDEALCEVEDAGLRYVLRRNPQRAAEVAATRQSKREAVAALVKTLNDYLQAHPRATTRVALAKVRAKMTRLRIDKWLTVRVDGRLLRLVTDEPAWAAVSRLDGCYVIKTDLPAGGQRGVPCEVIHDRYKDLAEVEQGFRTYKTDFLEVRPVYVRTAESTRGHVLVVMLAYKIVRALRRAWARFDLTVQEGLRQLETLCATQVQVKGQASFVRIPTPREQSQQLLDALDVRLLCGEPEVCKTGDYRNLWGDKGLGAFPGIRARLQNLAKNGPCEPILQMVRFCKCLSTRDLRFADPDQPDQLGPLPRAIRA